ncbi:MAG: twin-arginine translocase TatA/TatE family subunit [Armatimonadetes bacterium]|nr:twin-arginine translocase TatA/TatE family subunit [Armatimonadota bacterium]
MFPIAWVPNGPELIVVLVIIMLLFGVKKLPEIGKSMAEGIHEFKKAGRELKKAEEDEESKAETETVSKND